MLIYSLITYRLALYYVQTINLLLLLLLMAELRGVKNAQFSDFGLFSQHKTPKKYLPVIRLQPRGYRRMITIFLCGSRGSKGVPVGSGVFLRHLVGQLGSPKHAQIFAYGK